MSLLPLLLSALILGPGCKNACQDLCTDMYNFALDCGYEFPEEQLDACYEDMSSSETPRTTRDYCRDYQDIGEWWTCEEIGRYFGDDGSGQPDPEDTASGS